jgi:hypothetical protein
LYFHPDPIAREEAANNESGRLPPSVNKLSKPFCCFERSIAFLLALGVCGRLSVVFSLVFCLLFSSPFHFRLLFRAGMDILSDALRSVTD